MATLPKSVAAFLSGQRFAVAGVSRQPNQAANAVFRKLKASGYDVVPINPKATEVEGVRCYNNVGSVPDPLDGVVIATAPAAATREHCQATNSGVGRVLKCSRSIFQLPASRRSTWVSTPCRQRSRMRCMSGARRGRG